MNVYTDGVYAGYEIGAAQPYAPAIPNDSVWARPRALLWAPVYRMLAYFAR